jgi:pimeloyl-ACP methyl ester carboxylesterase
VLVFTHGWGADRGDWTDLVASLPATYRIVTWDLPGLGDSTKLGDDQYQVATLADQLERVVASQGGRPVMLVGHSIGGMINLEYARRHPERLGHDVVGLVQVDTTFTNPVETKKHADRSRKLQKPVYEPLLHVVAATSPVCRALGWLAYRSGLAHLQLATQSFAGAETREQLDRMARYAYQSSPRVVAEGTLGMMHWDATPVLATLRVPTLILSGAQDTTTLPSASQRMNAEIPQSTLVSISPAAHLGPVEQAARYAGAIDAFAQARTATVSARAS